MFFTIGNFFLFFLVGDSPDERLNLFETVPIGTLLSPIIPRVAAVDLIRSTRICPGTIYAVPVTWGGKAAEKPHGIEP